MRTDQHHALIWNIVGTIVALFLFSGFVIVDSAVTKFKQTTECAKLSNGDTLQTSHYPWDCHKEPK